MLRKLVIITFAICSNMVLNAQTNYLNNRELMALSDSCLKHTYDFSFNKARQFQEKLVEKTPDHPAPYFLEALIIYWENFPLMPKNEFSRRFIKLMDRSV